jgi:hypothetical protein
LPFTRWTGLRPKTKRASIAGRPGSILGISAKNSESRQRLRQWLSCPRGPAKEALPDAFSVQCIEVALPGAVAGSVRLVLREPASPLGDWNNTKNEGQANA